MDECNYFIKQKNTKGEFSIRMNISYFDDDVEITYFDKGEWSESLPQDSYKNAEIQNLWDNFINDLEKLVKIEDFIKYVSNLKINEFYNFSNEKYDIINSIVVINEG
ncbi:hypothetical protein [Methanobrevibacter sp. DSM 116169]|uniref:hypothetical protein n=1 Tax=Methanobrevibacter sp. DSM 116169 TaxID=3242727 RepID=UPI0038FD3626